MSDGAPLSELLSVVIDHRGRTPLKLGSAFAQAGIPVLSAKSVKGGRIHLSDTRFVDEDLYERWMPRKLKPGDVLLTSEGPLGEVAYLQDAHYCLGQRLFALRAEPSRLDGRFLFYWLQSAKGQQRLAARASGTTVLGIRQAELLKVRVDAPPVRRQRSIAGVLGALDDKIELNRRMNETLEETASTLFAQEFSNADEIKLIEEFDLTMGQSPPGETYNDTGEGKPFFQGSTDFGFRFPRNRIYCTAPTRSARAGDTLVSVRAPVGDVNMALNDCAIGRGVAAVRHKTGSRSATYYAMRLLRTAFDVFDAEGTVFGSLSKADFASMRVRSLAQGAERFEALAGPLDARIELNERESRTLAELRDTLLPKLISGELRVRDAETELDALP